MDDIVIDTNVARLFDAPADSRLKELFLWLKAKGCLAISQHLLTEYYRQGNQLLAIIIRDLGEQRRLNRIETSKIKAFTEDKHDSYCCNPEDIGNARTVFLSDRKLLVTFDKNLMADVNGFRKVEGIKPRAFKYPPQAILC